MGAEFEAIVGTYEHFLVGYSVKLENDENTEEEDALNFVSKQSFTNNSHSGSVTAITTMGKYLLSGSTDEIIRIVNMETRAEHGSLQKQNGTITCLAAYDKDYLFSGSEDGTICIWKSGSWLCEKTLHAHQGGVVALAVHPSGKVALSVGKDKALKTWNLIKGRCGYVTNLKGVADAVEWSSEGTYFAVGIASRVDVYSLQGADIVYSIPFGKRVTRIVFLNDDTCIVAGDKEEIEVHSVTKKSKLSSFNAHKTRVKDLTTVSDELFLSVSNDGLMKFWFFEDDQYTSAPRLVHQIDTTCRNMCVTVYAKETPDVDEVDDS